MLIIIVYYGCRENRRGGVFQTTNTLHGLAQHEFSTVNFFFYCLAFIVNYFVGYIGGKFLTISMGGGGGVAE